MPHEPERCYSLSYIKDFMRIEGIEEMEVTLAIKDTDKDFFFCKEYQEVGEAGDCGRHCKAYRPRNGKSGCCVNYGSCYIESDVIKKLKIKH